MEVKDAPLTEEELAAIEAPATKLLRVFAESGIGGEGVSRTQAAYTVRLVAEVRRLRAALGEEAARAERDYEPSGYVAWLRSLLPPG